jgi:methionyl aminopeptidase
VIRSKSPDEIEGMRRAGRVVVEAIQAARLLLCPGVTTRRLDEAIVEVIEGAGADAVFRGMPAPGVSPYPAASCLSVNDQALHAIPSEREIQDGDLVSIDAGCRLGGWCADAACSFGVGAVDRSTTTLLDEGRLALETAVLGLRECRRWADVVRRVRNQVAEAGLALVEGPSGHGIGRTLHEDPQVGWSDPPPDDFAITPGLVIAVEPLVTTGRGRLQVAEDGWTLSSLDGHRVVHFEQTVAIGENGPAVLTPWE